RRLLALAGATIARGVEAHVFTERDFAAHVEAAGGVWHDLYREADPDDLDPETQPRPSRNVTFAGLYADAVARHVRETGAQLVVHDTFTVVGRAAAHVLGLPAVNVCAGHAIDPRDPGRYASLPPGDPRRHTSATCLRSVELLRERYGFPDASPFSYYSALSPHLNVYCEPSLFLDEDTRRRLEPIAFFGSLLPERAPDGPPAAGASVYVSFGTIGWRYWAPEMLDALRAVVEALGDRPALIGLGGADVTFETPPNVRVERWADQWTALRGAGLFVTHHGLNSTHEAVWHGVPMLGYPLLGDQPGMAATCERLGIAIPLARAARAPIGREDVERALAAAETRGEEMRAALARAREAEVEVIAARDEVLDRILALA
ncbi:MAG TPA: glycosyltransferase, partial [Solirubrobacteraceae bacterium]